MQTHLAYHLFTTSYNVHEVQVKGLSKKTIIFYLDYRDENKNPKA